MILFVGYEISMKERERIGDGMKVEEEEEKGWKCVGFILK